MIRVGFFASGFSNRHGSGTAKVTENLIINLCTKHNLLIQVDIFCNNTKQVEYINSREQFRTANLVILPEVRGRYFRSSRQYFKFAFLNKNYNLDILHFSVPRLYPFFWLFPAKKFICTFHAGGDVTAPREKWIFSREVYNLVAKTCFKKLNSIVAVSEYGKKEISTAYGIPANLVSVIYPGTDDHWAIQENIYPRESKRKIVVVIGRWQRYKNVQTVSEALSKTHPEILKPFYFIFLGRQITTNAELIRGHLSVLNKNTFKTIEFLEDKDYIDLLRQAHLVIVPSVNEGFSLPIFDAFGSGCRVMFHHPSPASELLSRKTGVLATDLSSPVGFMKLLSVAIDLDKANRSENQNYLKSIGATWQTMTRNYISEYEKIMGEVT